MKQTLQLPRYFGMQPEDVLRMEDGFMTDWWEENAENFPTRNEREKGNYSDGSLGVNCLLFKERNRRHLGRKKVGIVTFEAATCISYMSVTRDRARVVVARRGMARRRTSTVM